MVLLGLGVNCPKIGLCITPFLSFLSIVILQPQWLIRVSFPIPAICIWVQLLEAVRSVWIDASLLSIFRSVLNVCQVDCLSDFKNKPKPNKSPNPFVKAQDLLTYYSSKIIKCNCKTTSVFLMRHVSCITIAIKP